ncbi:uncharacterized protein LOC126906964 isoform X2 [Daktulosphaira vitifoliae]|uniref:uncharacterized protein LOC126906964 isoform X2 n=1 Tax=Daktulosphaira vitifoliae TaxID=58002 RepID=UPI0021AA1ED8|nr:uncharacterized protein LOC126906964 isoform X2 [Daktulosphaira vitifoliae]
MEKKSCLEALKSCIKCKELEMTFVNEKQIFAEICLRYDDDSSTNYSKTKINLEITFGKENIILSYQKKEKKKFSYNANGYNVLQTFLNDLNKNIYFKVVKIYESNVPINRDLVNDTVYNNEIKDLLSNVQNLSLWEFTKYNVVIVVYPSCPNETLENCIHNSTNGNLVNDTVYDEQTKTQLSKVQNLFLWKYVKEDLVSDERRYCPYLTLEHFINNSTTYKKTVEQTLNMAIDIMISRTARYACLLVVYAYQTFSFISGPYTNDARKVSDVRKENWETVIKLLTILAKAENDLKKYTRKSISFIDIEHKLTLISLDKYSNNKLLDLAHLVKLFTISILGSKEFDENYFENARHSKNNTHILPKSTLEKLFVGFPKHHENYAASYYFENIPTALDNIIEKLEIILQLIKTEYGSGLK